MTALTICKLNDIRWIEEQAEAYAQAYEYQGLWLGWDKYLQMAETAAVKQCSCPKCQGRD